MKKIINILRNAALCSVLIHLFFYLFAVLSGYSVAALKLDQYLLLVLCGTVLSLAAEIFKLRFLPIPVRYLINYLVTVGVILLVFFIGGKIPARSIFVFIIAASVLYAVIAIALSLILRPFREEKKCCGETEKYNPIFKNL